MKQESSVAITKKSGEKLTRLAYLLNCTKQDAADLAIRTLYEQEVYHHGYRRSNKFTPIRRVLSICGPGGKRARGEP